MTQRVQIVICCLAVGLLLGPACSPDRPSGDQEELAWEAIGIRDYTPSADQKRFDVAHYGLVLTLDLEASAVSGRLSVRGKKEKSLDVLELDLYDNMKVQRVSSGKGDLKFGRSRRHKLRIALPDADLVLSTRERASYRDGMVGLGITRMSAGSRTDPGGYASEVAAGEQFAVTDQRSPAEVAATIERKGYEAVWKDWDREFLG